MTERDKAIRAELQIVEGPCEVHPGPGKISFLPAGEFAVVVPGQYGYAPVHNRGFRDRRDAVRILRNERRKFDRFVAREDAKEQAAEV